MLVKVAEGAREGDCREATPAGEAERLALIAFALKRLGCAVTEEDVFSKGETHAVKENLGTE